MVHIMIKMIVAYLFVTVSMKLLGKRQAGEMQMTELVTAFFLSELATQAVIDSELGIWKALFLIVVLLLLELLISYLAIKLPLFKKLFDFSPSIIIAKGEIDRKALKKNRMTLDELLSLLRLGGFYDITKVNFAILEPNGSLSIVPFPSDENLTKADLQMPVDEGGYSVAVIDDGRINEKALRLIGRSRAWLYDELRKHKATSVKRVFLLQSDFLGRTRCYFYQKEEDHSS